MRLLIAVLFVLNVWSVFGQTFNRRYDLFELADPQVAWSIEHSSDAYLLIQTVIETDSLGPDDYFTHPSVGITRIDGITGVKQLDGSFHPAWHGAGAGWANGTDSMPGGGVVVGGVKQDTLQNLSALLMVFDAQGDTVFTRDISPPGSQWNGASVKHTLDGGFIVVGQTDATGYLDGFAIKTDPLGNVEWQRTYGRIEPLIDALIFVVELSEGDYILGGISYPTNSSSEQWLMRIDPMGEPLWEVLWPPTSFSAGPHISLLTSGNILLASNMPYATEHMQDRFYMAVVDPVDGSIIWEREYAERARFQTFFAAKETPNGDFIACGVSQVPIGYHGVLFRTSSEGDSLWMRKYVYQDDVILDGAGQFYDVLPTPDGGFIATGPVYGRLDAPNPPGYSQDAWVVKVDGDGCIVPGCDGVGITEQATNLLDAITVFPNPVQQGGSVTVQLDLPPYLQGKKLELTVVASDGRVVAKEWFHGTTNNYQLTTNNYTPDLYYLHVSAGSKWLTGGKLVVE